MTPAQFAGILKRYWILVSVVTLSLEAIFVSFAVTGQRPYEATLTLSVQPPTASTNINTSFLQFAVPVVQARLAGAELKESVQQAVDATPGSFEVSVDSTPGSGLLSVTVSSADRTLVGKALRIYSVKIGDYPGEANLPVAVNVLQPALAATRNSLVEPVILAGVEGLVLGFAVAVALALILATFRSSKTMEERLSRREGVTNIVSVIREGGGFRDDEYVRLAAHLRSQLRIDGLSIAVVPASETTGLSRSLTTVQLGRAMAEADVRVMIVDADLRESHLSEALAAVGVTVTSPLEGMAHKVMYTDVPGLLVVRNHELGAAAGEAHLRPVGPARTVSVALRSLVAQARNLRAVLILDCPAPEAAEAHAILAGVDGALLVNGGPLRRQGQGRLEDLVSLVRRLGAEVLGLVVAPKGGADSSQRRVQVSA